MSNRLCTSRFLMILRISTCLLILGRDHCENECNYSQKQGKFNGSAVYIISVSRQMLYSDFSMKTYMYTVGTQYIQLSKTVLASTLNIYVLVEKYEKCT